MPRKLLTFIIVIFILIWVTQDPGHAGATVHGWITSAFTFMHGLAS